MKATVIGAGKMGTVAARNLANKREVTHVELLDKDDDRLEKVESNDDIEGRQTDVRDDALVSTLEGSDALLLALPFRSVDYPVIEKAIEAGTDVVDILEEYHRHPSDDVEPPRDMTHDEYGRWLHQKATEKDVTVISGCGLAPGLTNITIGRGIALLDEAFSGVARVGGIPEKKAAERLPLGYGVTWSLDHVWREYHVPAEVIRDGEFKTVDSLSGHETFSFDGCGHDDKLECFITPGMPSIPHTRDLERFEERTIRWPGHHEEVETLKNLGLFSGDPVDVDNAEVAPGDFLEISLETEVSPRNFLTFHLEDELSLREDERDVVNMWNTVSGYRDGEPVRVHHRMWEYAEEGRSAMARTTASTAALATKYVMEGETDESGIVASEDFINGALYSRFIDEMDEQYDVQIEEEIEELDEGF